MQHVSGTVLVVDDNEDNQELLSRWLRRLGHTVITVPGGADALKLLHAQPVDLILLDIMMPEMDGYQFLEYFNAEPALRHIPVVVLSARLDVESVARCIELGAEDYLFKPFNVVLLNARVSAGLEKKRLREQEQTALLTRLVQLTSNAQQPYCADRPGALLHLPDPNVNADRHATIISILDALEVAHAERRRMEAELKRLNTTLEQQVAERSAAAEQRAQELAQSEEALRRETQILCSILNSLDDGVVVVDEHADLLHLNPAAEQILQLDPVELSNWCRRDSTHFYQTDMITPYPPDMLPLARALRGEVVTATEIFVQHIDWEAGKWLSATAYPLKNKSGRTIGGVVVFRDITADRQAAVALRESEERYALAAQGANDGLWDWDLRTNQVYFSPRWKSMLGWSEQSLGSSPDEWFGRIHRDDLERVQVHLAAHFKGLITHFENEHRMQHRDGVYRWMLCRGVAVRDAAGQVTRMAGSLTDITDRKLAEAQLLHGALYDGLTGLPNRALFLDRLERAMAQARQRQGYQFAVLFLDIDRFKLINDSLGHTAGDQLLVAFARRLERCLQTRDTVARLGGDEFTILLEGITGSDDAIRVAGRIQSELRVPLELQGQEVVTSVSIGIALGSAGYEQTEDILRDADTAMYQAKAQGKACHAVFDMSMRARVLERLQMEGDLRRAIARREFHVYYQPIVALETGCIAGFEALVRWEHPQRGFISPHEFIPIAEETGLIIPIGYWVLREACYQLRAWQLQFAAALPLTISVNISGRQFAQPNLVEQIRQTLWETGLEARYLKVEITESVIMEHGEATITRLQKLRDLGVQLSIDDFGTGYSSLSYLQRFPINTLKIDRSFVSRIGKNGENVEIIQAILALVRSLNIDAIAEGAETTEQVAQLKLLKCDYGQGWWFSGAVDAATATRLIASTLPYSLPGQSVYELPPVPATSVIVTGSE
jgi:diguanylate cyclase (GGDEF)-like protein/PAS domain S-box-containing protein